VSAARDRLAAVLAPELVDALEELIAQLVLEGLAQHCAKSSWLTLEQAAARYKTTAAALRKRAQRGRLPGAARDCSRWLVDTETLDRALLDGTLDYDNANGRAPR
jgi:hypothetical protein